MVTSRQGEQETDQKRGEDEGVERNVTRDRIRGRGRGNERKRENSALVMTSLLSRGIYLSFDLIRVYLC